MKMCALGFRLAAIMMMALVAAVVLLTPAVAEAGPDDPIYNPQTRSYYKLDTRRVPWDQAYDLSQRSSWQGRRGRLVTITTYEEMRWLVDRLGNGLDRSWTNGIRDGRRFRWANGEKFDWAPWCPGQPDNGGGGVENRIAIWKDRGPVLGFGFNDLSQNAKCSFLIEFPPQ